MTGGTQPGTFRLADIVPGSGSSHPRYLTAIGGLRAVFSAVDDTGRELWVTNGTGAARVRTRSMAAMATTR